MEEGGNARTISMKNTSRSRVAQCHPASVWEEEVGKSRAFAVPFPSPKKDPPTGLKTAACTMGRSLAGQHARQTFYKRNNR